MDYLILAIVVGVSLVAGYILRGWTTKTDGTLDISEKDSSKIHQLEIDTTPEKLGQQKKMVLRIRRVTE